MRLLDGSVSGVCKVVVLDLYEGHIGVDGRDLGFRRLDIAVVELVGRPAGGPEPQRERF